MSKVHENLQSILPWRKAFSGVLGTSILNILRDPCRIQFALLQKPRYVLSAMRTACPAEIEQIPHSEADDGSPARIT